MWSPALLALLELELLDAIVELNRLDEEMTASTGPYDSAVVFMAADIFEDRLGFGLDDLEEPDLDRLMDEDWVIRTAWADCVDLAQNELVPKLRAC